VELKLEGWAEVQQLQQVNSQVSNNLSPIKYSYPNLLLVTDGHLKHFEILPTVKYPYVDLGGLVVSVLATGPKVRGFDPDRGRWIFKGEGK
jgi:hypothetical protein